MEPYRTPYRPTTQRLAFALCVAATGLLAVCAASAGRFRPAPVAPPQVVVTPAALTTGTPTLDADELNKARQAARDFVREAYPGSKQDGVFALPFGRGTDLALAGVDTRTAEGERVTIDLLVRRYVRKNGAAYWRAEKFGRDSAAYEVGLK